MTGPRHTPDNSDTGNEQPKTQETGKAYQPFAWEISMINNYDKQPEVAKSVASTVIFKLGTDINFDDELHKKAIELLLMKVLEKDNVSYDDLDKVIDEAIDKAKDTKDIINLKSLKIIKTSLNERNKLRKELEQQPTPHKAHETGGTPTTPDTNSPQAGEPTVNPTPKDQAAVTQSDRPEQEATVTATPVVQQPAETGGMPAIVADKEAKQQPTVVNFADIRDGQGNFTSSFSLEDGNVQSNPLQNSPTNGINIGNPSGNQYQQTIRAYNHDVQGSIRYMHGSNPADDVANARDPIIPKR